MKTLTEFIREHISDIPYNITDTHSIAVRSYLNYLSEKSLLSDEVIRTYKQVKDKRFQTIFKILAFSGVRITELVKMAKEYNPSKLIVNDKFSKCQLHYNRGHKSLFYI